MSHLTPTQAEKLMGDFGELKLEEYRAKFPSNPWPALCGYYETILAQVLCGILSREQLQRHMRREIARMQTGSKEPGKDE
ncbi:MAG: hypothetical protein ACYC6C_13955 [Coriobacteriia bacterium]